VIDFRGKFRNSMPSSAVPVLLGLGPPGDWDCFQQVNLLLRQTHNLAGNVRDPGALHVASLH
jgi:hypothetical protein